IENIGLATVTNYNAQLTVFTAYNTTPTTLAFNASLGELKAGGSKVVNFSWVVNESVVGDHGAQDVTFDLTTTWDGGPALPGGGDFVIPVTVHVLPAYITLYFTPPVGPFQTGDTYVGGGTVTYVGAGDALINVTLTGIGGIYPAGQGAFANGTFHQSVAIATTMQAGATYSLTITAYYDGRTVNETFPGAVLVSAPPAPASSGIPLWVWLVIAAAAVLVGAFLAVRFLAAKAKPKLVECGECGELIPESATVCPKCGAEFEPDLVRCSRCAATIPAKSAICPECAATLLGTPGEEAKDPERQGFADFTEKYRAEGKKELGDNFSEGAFWDWWRRQPSYVSFDQWKAQQSGGSRSGMTGPSLSSEPVPANSTTDAAAAATPPKGGAGGAVAPADAGESATTAAPAANAASSGTMRACTNCSKEIPSDFLVCPFCGAVTR
ncbi:MAG: zinc ribbon domain-containing protein, partial [Thermoplasmata archaeon]|nr:zinc ribbon domain-containing protein [Thermoplasmata archaeon]